MRTFFTTRNKIILVGVTVTLPLMIYLYKINPILFIEVTSIICKRNVQQERRECLQEKILQRIEKTPKMAKGILDSIWELSEKGMLTDDMRLFSPIIHDVGMILANKKRHLVKEFNCVHRDSEEGVSMG